MSTDEEKLRNIYGGVKTFGDMLEINVKFLKGEIPLSFSVWDPIDSETIPLLGDLIKLNTYGFLTTEGQPRSALAHDDPQNKNKPSLTIQRSYLCGFFPIKYLKLLIRFLKEKKLYYTYSDMDSVYHNIPTRAIEYNKRDEKCVAFTKTALIRKNGSLGKYKINSALRFRRKNRTDYEAEIDAVPKFIDRNRVLGETVYLNVTTRDFLSENVEKLLLEFFEKYRWKRSKVT